MGTNTNNGFLPLSKAIVTSSVFTKPGHYLKAWIWLIVNANWKNCGRLKRGQVFFTYEILRQACHETSGYRKIIPTKKAMRSAIDWFRSENMILTEQTHGGLIATVVKYDEYNPKNGKNPINSNNYNENIRGAHGGHPGGHPGGHDGGHPGSFNNSKIKSNTYDASKKDGGHPGGHDGGNSEGARRAPSNIENNEKGIIKKHLSHDCDENVDGKIKIKGNVPKGYHPDFETFWQAYPKRQGKRNGKRTAFTAWWRLVRDGVVDRETLVERITVLAPGYGEYPKDPATWLRAYGWQDEFDAHEADGGAPKRERSLSVLKYDGLAKYKAYCQKHGLPLDMAAMTEYAKGTDDGLRKFR